MKKMLLKIEEAAEIIGIGRHKLRELTEYPDFPVIKIGSKRMVIMGKVEEWFSKHRGELV